ncbi:hypothetical protein BN871_EX_00270 [Paenibacillus sp. P22]|nr:hypothetical protein BN871_EX_00270 [Paenibacillus sp. P22]
MFCRRHAYAACLNKTGKKSGAIGRMVARGGIPLFKAMSAMAGFHVSNFASPLRLPGSHVSFWIPQASPSANPAASLRLTLQPRYG